MNMKEYHKIQTVFKRDPETKYKTLLMGQYSQPEFEYLKNNTWVFTEKVDGTNIRIIKQERIIFKGKTDNAQIPSFLLDKLKEIFTIDLMKEVFPDTDACLYGEGYGARIQKGGGNYIANGVDFILFDIRIGEWWLKREDVEDVADKLNIKTVPIIREGTLYDLVDWCREEHQSLINSNHMAEGIVARPKVELKDRAGRRIITKLKHKDFNVKEEQK